MSQIEDSVALMPIPQLDWRFADRWKLHVGLTNLGYTGVGPELSYSPAKSWQIALGASYQTRRYRLDDHSGISNGVGEETSAPIFTSLRWHPHPQATLDLFAGVAVAGHVRLENQTGDKVASSDYDPAPILGLRGQFVF